MSANTGCRLHFRLVRQSELKRSFHCGSSLDGVSCTSYGIGDRLLSTQAAAGSLSNERIITDFDATPSSPATNSDDEWFGDRYRDKSYHAVDGMDPAEWILIYRIPDEKQRDRMEYSLYGAALLSLACGCVIFGISCKRRDENPFAVAPGLWLACAMAVGYATRLRRYGVVRLYARKLEQEQWERWRISQLALPPPLRDVNSPPRRFCIIWKDLFRRPHAFAYHSRQISDAVHRKTWLARAMNGSFLVLGRPWAVHPDYFDEPPDYIFARRWL